MARRRRDSPAGAWRIEEALWGELQRVRLVTGPPSLVERPEQVRSIHAVGFLASGQVLLVQNKDGSWTFPGGRLEGGESLEAALARELWEEARARLSGCHLPLAATRIEFMNRVPGRVYRFHPTYLLWVTAEIVELSDEPHHDPANAVIARQTMEVDEAWERLPELERLVLKAAQERWT